MSMDHVKVHYNSDKPAQLQAHAYAQGNEIHLGAGQERHLPHEAWHVVQQAQGRVRPTLQMKAGAVNDDPSLEKEADMMGAKAAQLMGPDDVGNLVAEELVAGVVTQRFVDSINPSSTPRALHHNRKSPVQAKALPQTSNRGGSGHGVCECAALVHQRSSSRSSEAIIQRYSQANGFKISHNSQYAVSANAANRLYVLHDPQGPNGGQAAPPTPVNLITAGAGTTLIGGFTYQHYTYPANHAFVNDCLEFAENVARETDQSSARAEFRARENRPNGQADRLFGNTDATNTAIANTPTFNQAAAAIPAVGEAYATVRTVQGQGTPYHAATVVAHDAPDNVTVEADAGNLGATAPVFDMYDTIPPNLRPAAGANSLTFHETYSGRYTTGQSAPATGTLYPRID